MAPNLYINRNLIENVSSFNYLGLMLNENLNWSLHIKHICTKLSRSIGVFRSLRHLLPLDILLLLYNSLCLSLLNYCISVWGGNHSASVFLLQKKLIRVITFSKVFAHTDPLFKMLNIIKISDLFKIKVCKIYYNYIINKLPYYFMNTFNFEKSSHQYPTRCNKLKLNFKIIHQYECNRIQYSIVKVLNLIPTIVTDKIFTHSFNSFSKYLKLFFINSYETNCTLRECFVCNGT